MSPPSSDFDRLVVDAEAASFSGWDFSWLEGRVIERDGGLWLTSHRFYVEAVKP